MTGWRAKVEVKTEGGFVGYDVDGNTPRFSIEFVELDATVYPVCMGEDKLLVEFDGRFLRAVEVSRIRLIGEVGE